MTNKKDTHTSIREELFKQTSPGRKVTKELSNGLTVEIRQPSRKLRNELIAECRIAGENPNMFMFMDKLVIKCTYNPETGNRVFRDSDYDEISKMEEVPWLDELVNAASELLNVSVEGMEKN